jgi:anti-anti-sigma factor
MTLASFDVQRLRDGFRTIEVHGDVDLTNAPEFKEVAMAAIAPGDILAIDLSDCQYIDSRGLGVLIALYKELGHVYPLVVPQGSFLRRLLRVTGLESLFDFYENPEAMWHEHGAAGDASASATQ